MSNVAESQIITNIAISDKRVESPLEKLPRFLFSSTIEFFIDDLETLINFRRCNRKVLSLCTEGLRTHLGRINELNLSHVSYIRLLPQISNSNLSSYVPKLTHLKFNSFDISYSRLDNYSRFFFGLNHNCENLRSVSLKSLPIQKVLDFILPNIPPEITSFELEVVIGDLGSQLLEEIGARFTNLEYLKLNFSSNNNTPINNSPIQSLLTKCVKLKTLHMISFNGLDHQIADYFSNCRNITDLNLYSTSIGARGIQKIVERCLTLTILDIHGNEIDDEAMQAICKNCINLTQIEMDMCTPHQFLMFENCTELTKLVISKCNVTDAGLVQVVGNCKKLEHIIILKNNIIDKSNIFKKFPQIDFFI